MLRGRIKKINPRNSFNALQEEELLDEEDNGRYEEQDFEENFDAVQEYGRDTQQFGARGFELSNKDFGRMPLVESDSSILQQIITDNEWIRNNYAPDLVRDAREKHRKIWDDNNKATLQRSRPIPLPPGKPPVIARSLIQRRMTPGEEINKLV